MDEEGGRETYQDNEDFKGTPLSELIDEELNGWVGTEVAFPGCRSMPRLS